MTPKSSIVSSNSGSRVFPSQRSPNNFGVPAPTLYHWNETARPRIHKLRLLKLEQAEEHLLGTQDVQFEALASNLKVIDELVTALVKKGTAQDLSLPELVRIGGSLRRQLHRLKLHVRDPLVEHAKTDFADPAQPLVLSTRIQMDGTLIDEPKEPE